jgi:hypothetical protein
VAAERGAQPGGIYAHVAQREPTPGAPGSGWRVVVIHAASASQASRRPGTLYTHQLLLWLQGGRAVGGGWPTALPPYQSGGGVPPARGACKARQCKAMGSGFEFEKQFVPAFRRTSTSSSVPVGKFGPSALLVQLNYTLTIE